MNETTTSCNDHSTRYGYYDLTSNFLFYSYEFKMIFLFRAWVGTGYRYNVLDCPTDWYEKSLGEHAE